MTNVGFFGGPTVSELGPAADVQLFFDCINAFAVAAEPEKQWTLLTDRLYRRYLRPEELAPAQALMDEVERRFRSVPSSAVDWGEIRSPGARTRLDPSQPTLADVFSEYFRRFARSREEAERFYKKWNIYQPVKIVVSDMPGSLADQDRPMEEYDSLQGAPFWRR